VDERVAPAGAADRDRPRSPAAASAPGRVLLPELAFVLFVLLLSHQFVFLRFNTTIIYTRASPEALARGTAPTPYQYRILVPAIARLSGDPGTAYRIVEFAATVALCYATRRWLSLYLGDLRLASLATVLLGYVLPYNFAYTLWYPWDIPGVLFVTLGLVLLRCRRWTAYYGVFALATVNRETTYLLTLIHCVTALGRDRRDTILRHVAAQGGIWLAIKAALYLAFRENRVQGIGLFDIQLLRNLGQLARPDVLVTVLRSWGMLWIVVALGLQRIEDRFLRRALLACVVQLVILLLVGVIEELRVYGEIIPIVLAAVVVIARDAVAGGRSGRSQLC
jgi:hypothetical protein